MTRFARYFSLRLIANKIIVLVLLIELLSIGIWGSMTYLSSRDELVGAISSRLSEAAVRTSNDIGGFFDPIRIEMQVLAANLNNANLAEGSRTALLHRLLKVRPELDQAGLVNANGQEQLRLSRVDLFVAGDLRALGEDPVVAAALNGRSTLSGIRFSEYLEPQVRLGVPIGEGDKGALFAQINLKWLWDTVQEQAVGKTGYVYVVDRSLSLIAHPDPSLVLGQASVGGAAIPPGLFNAMGGQQLLIYRSLDGKRVAGVSYYDPDYDWWVVVELPVAEGLAPLDRLIRRFVLAFITAMLLSIVAVLVFSRLTMRPLQQLENGIAQLHGGQRNVRIDVPRNTELADLVLAFNSMAEGLDAQNRELEYRANHDVLTGLANRNVLHARVKQALHERTTDVHVAMLLLDLDSFKEVNDSLGHKAGDELLVQLADRLRARLPNETVIVRLGGDEFGFALLECRDPAEAVRQAEIIRDACAEPFVLEDITVRVDGSVGISLAPQHGTDSSTLLRFADIAMYHAKRFGKRWALYDTSIDASSPRRLQLLSSLGDAIANEELVLHYQPKIDVESGEVNGVEALVRWQHPNYGLIMPDEFIGLAELGEQIGPLTRWVIRRGLADCAAWRGEGHSLVLSLNVSARNLQDQELTKFVADELQRVGIPCVGLCLEITESAIMVDPERAADTLRAMQALGVKVAIDDYGTGYSSLSYLKQLSVDELKIDRSFVMDMETDEHDAVIVRSTIDLSHHLGMKVTAEGVENKDILMLLSILGCDYAQGYHFARPLPEPELRAWLRQQQQANG